MKWDKAINKIREVIEGRSDEGFFVEIEYHRTHITNQRNFGVVDNLVEYDYKGQKEIAINVSGESLVRGAFIIDNIEIL